MLEVAQYFGYLMNILSLMRKIPGKYYLMLVFAAYAVVFSSFFLFSLFPSQDGAAHINSAFILDYLDKGDPFFLSYFTRTPAQFTNWVAGAILSVFIHVIPINHVEMLFVFLYACLMMLSVIFSLKFCFRVNPLLSVFFLPLVFSQTLHMGSFNYCLGYSFFPLLIGLCYLYLQRPSYVKVILISAFLLFMYCIHIQIAAIGAGFVFGFAAWPIILRLVFGLRPMRQVILGEKQRVPQISDGLTLAVACLPVIIASVMFMTNNQGIANDPSYSGFLNRISHLLILRGIASYSAFGLFIAFLMACCLLGGIALTVRDVLRSYRPSSIDPCIFCVMGLVALCLFVPEGIGEIQDIEDRVMIPMLMALLCWLFVRREDLWLQPTAILLVFVLILGQGVDRFIAWSAINKNFREYSEVISAIPDKQAIYSMDFDTISTCANQKSIVEPFKVYTRFLPYMHFLGYVIADRAIANVGNYEAHFRNPYFPLKFSDEFRRISADAELPEFVRSKNPVQNIEAFVAIMKDERARPVSYLLIWNSIPSCPFVPVETEIMDSVQKNYDLVFSSSNKRVSLYKMKRLD